MKSIYDEINSRLLSIKSQIEKDKNFIKLNPRHSRVFILNNDIDKSLVAINQLEWVLNKLCKTEPENKKFYCSQCNLDNPCSSYNFGIECEGEIKYKNQTL